MKTRHILVPLLLSGIILPAGVSAQQEEEQDPSHLQLSGSVDFYYAYYNDSLPLAAFRQTGTDSPRSNQFGINVAQARLAYDHPSVRGRLALHYGDVPLSSWSPDFPVLQEASAGVRLADGLWVDGGFFPTHIGAESIFPGSNRTTSIAALSYFEPFYQSGIRVSYEAGKKFSAQLHLLNGYNTFVDRNNDKSAGTYLSWRPAEQIGFIYATLLGNEGADTGTSLFRTYHNLQATLGVTDALQVVFEYDFSTQSNSAAGGGGATAMGGFAIVSYAITAQWKVNGRVEFFDDPDGFLAGTFRNDAGEPAGPSLIGGTLGIEHRPTSTSYLRLEGRMLQTSRETTFFGGDALQKSRIEAGLSGGISFDSPVF